MPQGSILPKLAFLGPKGTYTHQAAYGQFATSVEYCEKNTITEVFDAISPEIPLAVVPQENSTFGAVIETCDLLKLPSTGRRVFVCGEITIDIQHCLIVREGVKLRDIKTVMSHEQALGQCQDFILRNLPGATVEKMSSTGAAAQALLLPLTGDRDPRKCAAICSKMITVVLAGLEILHENIQDGEANQTRFYILSERLADVPGVPLGMAKWALVRLCSLPATKGVAASSGPTINVILDALNMRMIRIERRPSTYSIPFHDVYLIELQQEGNFQESGEDGRPWLLDVNSGLQRVREIGGEASLLGVW